MDREPGRTEQNPNRKDDGVMRRRNVLVTVTLALGMLPGLSAQAPPPMEISARARAHLVEIVAVLQRAWLHRAGMDWASFRERVIEKAGAAQTVPDTYDAIRHALTLLGDRHSYYITSTGEYIFSPESPTQSTGECKPLTIAAPAVPADVGYVRIQMTAQADTIQEALQEGDRAGVSSWIVDLRSSGVGSTWPPLAGIGSLLGNGTTGYFIDAANRATPWGYTNGLAWLQSPAQDLAFFDMPLRLRAPDARVAVLTDIGIAGPGEALAIAFRGRPDTRSFGTPTCGLSTAVSQISLSRGGTLGVEASVMADRTMKKYGGAIEPDELVPDPGEVVPRALAWLRRP
jgi:hypothetical protein